MKSITNLLLTIEKELLKKEVRSSSVLLDKYLDDDFVEHGKSGGTHTKADIINCLTTNATIDLYHSIDITSVKVRMLSESVALLTSIYIDKVNEEKINRSSIYKLNNNEWKMTFHQGTKSP